MYRTIWWALLHRRFKSYQFDKYKLYGCYTLKKENISVKFYLFAILNFTCTQSISWQDYEQPFWNWVTGLNCIERKEREVYIESRNIFPPNKNFYMLSIIACRTNSEGMSDAFLNYMYVLGVRPGHFIGTHHWPI